MTAVHTNTQSSGSAASPAWPVLLLPLLALLLVFPLLLHGPSCGHDFGFHMQSWMDASAQMRHGVLLPHWAYSPAFNAGEPRFIFYPPISWLLGSLLLLLLPASVVPAAFTFVALALAGLGMYRLARRFAASAGALLTAAMYMANPYLLFTAFERTAYAELLAAAWLPWLLRATLAEQPRILPICIPVALLWLTNAPAAVMGTYLLLAVVLLKAALQWNAARKSGANHRSSLLLLLRYSLPGFGGLLLGWGLASFYLIPAAWERRYVQIAMAIIPNMRIEDNFLFGHTGYGPHDAVLHTASLVAIATLALTAVALVVSGVRVRRAHPSRRRIWTILAVLSAGVGLLMCHWTLALWHLLPELVFLQFPWRWLSILGCFLGAAVALAVMGRSISLALSVGLSITLAASAGIAAVRPFRQGCETHELPADRVALFAAHHGVGPTDEYTPGDADNDQLRWDDPAWWLTTDLNAPGPDTVPNPAATIVDYDQPPPLNQTISGLAPMHLKLTLAHPQNLVLNLRDYPAWDVRVNHAEAKRLQRDDGLIAVSLPEGTNQVAIYWRRLPDVWLGDGVSVVAACTALALQRRSRSGRSRRISA